MAVQKSRKTHSKKGMKRSHQALCKPTLSTDKVSGETHRRHHMTADGYYRGKQIVVPKSILTDKEETTKEGGEK